MARDLDRRRFLTGVGAVATTAVAGCSDGRPTGDDTTADPAGGDDTHTDTNGETTGTTDAETDLTADTDGQLQMLQGPMATLDPIGISGQREAWVNWQIHERLFTYVAGTLPATGALATDYTVSDDYLTYEFTLKEGVTFHDGSELTAADVVYSWRRLAESENNRNSENQIVGNVMNIAHDETEDGAIVPDSMELEATGDYTLEMTLETPFHSTLGHLTNLLFSVIPEGAVGDIEGYEGEFEYDEWVSTHATGTGPFQLESWSRGSEVTISRFEEYHGSVANLDGIRWQTVEDPNARYTRAVNEQNADIFTIPRSQFTPGNRSIEDDLGGARRSGTYGPVNGTTLNYGEAGLPRTQYLIFHTLNVEKPARRAIAHALNHRVVTEQATQGLGQPAYFITPPVAFPGGPDNYHDIAESEYPYGYDSSNIQAARELMEAAGYSADNPYETSIMYPSDSQTSQWEAVANYLRDLGESVHIDLELESSPGSTLTNRAINGDFDIYCSYNALKWMEADSTLQYAYPNRYTWTRWGQAEDGTTDAAVEAADAWVKYEENREPTEEAQTARNEAYLTMERANWEDVTELPLWHPTDQVYWYDWVENYEVNGPMNRPTLNDISLADRS
ncbi:ABC transporter substrate-binding protein [Halosimplex sp. J119]